jgi:hypothetical protein
MHYEVVNCIIKVLKLARTVYFRNRSETALQFIFQRFDQLSSDRLKKTPAN